MNLSAESNNVVDLEVVVIGGGPAGLMAAQVLSRAGHRVDLFDAMPSVGRKFLLAGKGGMNLTHNEALASFVSRYAERADRLQPMLDAFGPQAVRDWAAGLGIETFVGSSQRVFPTDMKAAPLLRAWLHRLRHPEPGGVAVGFHMRHRWLGWDGATLGVLCFDTPAGERRVRARATVLALGGASWARLGSNGAWWPWLQAAGLAVAPLRPSNCGFDVGASPRDPSASGWSGFFVERFAGHPLKSVSLRVQEGDQTVFDRKGEFVITATGIEGSLVYAASSWMREAIARDGQTTVWLNLLPDRSPEWVLQQVSHPRGSRSLSSHLKSRLNIDNVKLGLINELCDKATMHDPEALSAALQALPLYLVAPRPIDEAISTAGGLRFEALDDGLMAVDHPGLSFAGEMLDWEAPTGGYLLTACLSSGVRAGQGVHQWLKGQTPQGTRAG